MLAYMSKKKKLVKIISLTEDRAIAQYEPVDEPGNIYMPLIANKKNVEDFQIVEEVKVNI